MAKIFESVFPLAGKEEKRFKAPTSSIGLSRDFYRDKSSCVLRFVQSKSCPQLVKIIYSKTPINPKKGKGNPKKGVEQ